MKILRTWCALKLVRMNCLQLPSPQSKSHLQKRWSLSVRGRDSGSGGKATHTSASIRSTVQDTLRWVLGDPAMVRTLRGFRQVEEQSERTGAGPKEPDLHDINHILRPPRDLWLFRQVPFPLEMLPLELVQPVLFLDLLRRQFLDPPKHGPRTFTRGDRVRTDEDLMFRIDT